MKKIVMVVLVILLVFVGCKEKDSTYLVEQEQTVEDAAIIENESVSETDEENQVASKKEIEDQSITGNLSEEKSEIYDYKKIYEYHNMPIENLEISDFELMFQDVGLEVENIDFSMGESIIITYALNLNEENKVYEFQRMKEVKNSIILFSIYSDVKEIAYRYVQDDYSSEIIYYKDDILQKNHIDNLDKYIQSESDFSEMAELMESLTYTPDVMSSVTFDQIIGEE